MDIRMFVCIRHARHGLVTRTPALNAIEDDAKEYDEENRAQCCTERNKDGNSFGMATICKRISIGCARYEGTHDLT